jgi:hypothetical protein
MVVGVALEGAMRFSMDFIVESIPLWNALDEKCEFELFVCKP